MQYRFNPQGAVGPYIGAEVTFFYVNLNDGNADNTFGGYGLLGLNFGTGRTRIFVEGIYRVGSSEVSYRVTPIESTTGSMDVGGFGANLGVMWTF